MENEKNPIKLNIRSDEIEAILGKTPGWLMRTGILILFSFVIILLIGSSYFKYPDIVNAKITISSEYPSVALIANTSGRLIHLDCKDKETVVINQKLGVVESSSSAEDLMLLYGWINKSISPVLLDMNDSIFTRELQLGEVMPYFLDLKMALINCKKFIELNYHAQNKKILEEQIFLTGNYITHTENQIELFESEIDLALRDYKRDSFLYKKNIISPVELEQSKRLILQKKISLEANMASLANVNTQLSKLKQNVLELDLDNQKQIQDHLDNIEQKKDVLRDRIEQWDKVYVLRSPYAGRLSWPIFWTKNQYIFKGDIFANLIPLEGGAFMGKLELPILKSGKVKRGQSVNIKLNNYPYMEYGILKGIIHSISAVPSKDSYKVEVELPNGMKTSYGKELLFSPEITGSADIITEDYTILQRLFFPIKSLMKNNDPSF